MVKCPKCKETNPDNANFCKSCRSPIPKSEDKIRCPNGHIMDPSWTECPICQAANKADDGEISQYKKTAFESYPNSNRPEPAIRKTKLEGTIEQPSNNKPNKKPRKTVVQSINEDENGSTAIQNRLVAFLVTFSIDSSGQFFPIREGRHTIGCGDNSDICIRDDNKMSSQHAVLLYRRGKFLFGDNLSTNGSFVNGAEVMDKIELNNYDTIKMGNTEFRFIMVDNSQD